LERKRIKDSDWLIFCALYIMQEAMFPSLYKIHM